MITFSLEGALNVSFEVVHVSRLLIYVPSAYVFLKKTSYLHYLSLSMIGFSRNIGGFSYLTIHRVNDIYVVDPLIGIQNIKQYFLTIITWFIMKEKKIGVLIYTFNRIHDAKINMELIKNVWSVYDDLADIPIVHAFNGEESWWPAKYLEDELIYIKNTGHFSGAARLMEAGFASFQEQFKNVDYVIVAAADTWILEPLYLLKVIESMSTQEKFLATCGWGNSVTKSGVWKDVALDFYILDVNWATSLNFFPLRYDEYKKAYEEVFMLMNMNIYLEHLFLLRFKQAILRDVGEIGSENLLDGLVMEYIYLMSEREPVTVYSPRFERKMYSAALGLIGHHDPVKKQIILRKYSLDAGFETMKFLESDDLSYFNNGFSVTSYVKNGKEIKLF